MKSRALSKELFEQLYYNKDLSRKDIAGIIGFSEQQVKYWRRRFSLPPRKFRRLLRYKLEFFPSASLAYVLGVMLGDGFLLKSKRSYKGKTSGTQFQVGLRTTEEPFAKSFCEHLCSLGMNAYIRNNPSEPRVYIVIAYCKAFYEWFKKLTLLDIKQLAEMYPLDFLRGFYESEGYVFNRKSAPSWRIECYNTKKALLLLVQEIGSKVGFNFSLRGPYFRRNPNYSPLYALSSYRKAEVTRFLEVIQPCIKLGEIVG